MPKHTDALLKHGPLGTANYRKQLGRSDELGDPAGKMRAILVSAGTTNSKGQDACDGVEGNALASALSLTCSYESLNAANDARPLQIRGLIEWGQDGHQCAARFDWLDGTVVQVAGSFVRVIAEVVDNQTSEETEPTHDAAALCRVGCFVAYYASSRRAPTLTQQVLSPADGSAIVEVPQFARDVTIYGIPVTVAQWLLGPNAVQAFAAVDSGGVTTRSAYVVPGPARYLQIGGAAAGLHTIVWGLSL